MPAAKKQKQRRVFQCPEPIAGRVLINFKQTAAKLGCHELTIYRHLKNIPDFPRPIEVTPHRRAFFEDEVDHYLQTRPRA